MNQAMVLSSGKAFIETVIYLTSLAFALKSILAAIPFIFIAISSPIIALRARTAVVRVPLAITLLGSATPVTVMTPATFIIPATTVSVPRALSSCIHSSKRIVGGALCKPDNQALEIRQDIQVLFQIQLQKAAIPDLEIVEGPMMKCQSPTY
ncbi:hypothetical protein K457DRAFT_20920 [Linnemannia elongata AG-77]|uniref:Uncharacterized protein n=1 Tax=Linnemannia elongata AG-77 TaxID=1314771 RepID=A0A197JU00_9FUNG|nr:hypothetical protein K457DRAFT_20920 [Linnemannia elongata AG-77]